MIHSTWSRSALVRASIAVFVVLTAVADTVVVPKVRLFSSRTGVAGVWLKTSDSRTASLAVFTFSFEGQQVPKWERKLSYIPSFLMVTEYGALATIRTLPGEDSPAISVFGTDGAPRRDYTLRDLVGDQEFERHLKGHVGKYWERKARFFIEDTVLIITFDWERDCRIEPE